MSVSKEPLSIRNNNPGNLRFANQPGATPGEGGFARFETPEAGLSAMQRQIELDTQERGLTLSAFLNKYAPPSENKTSNYIDFVAKKTGLDPSSVVPAERIGDLQRAMIEMEGGPRSLSHFTQVSTAQAPTKTPEAPTRAPGPRPTVQVASVNQLPESYRLALAANYIGDTEKESVTDQAMKLLEEIQLEDGGSGSSGTKTKIGSILAPSEKTVDPFAIMAKAQEESEPKRKPLPRMPVRFESGGEVSVDPNERVVRQAYQDIVQRTPDQEGLAYWTGKLANRNIAADKLHENIAAAAQGADVANAQKYASALQNRNLVTKAYQDILQRAPEQDGMSYWTGQLNTGAIRPEALRQNILAAAQGADTVNAQQYAQNFAATQPQPVQTVDASSYRNPYGPTKTLNTLASAYSIANTFIPGMQAIPIIHYGLEALSLGNTVKKIGKVLGFAEGGEAQKFSDEQVSQFLKAAPEMTDRQIAEAMNKYNVSQEQVSRVTGVTMPEVQRRYREATALTARPTLEGIGALWNKLHEAQFGTPVNLATAGRENIQAQVTELQKEAERQQAEWDAKYGAGMPKQAAPMPTWGDTYNAWAPLYEQRFGTMINRPWNADVDAQNQKLALDQQYIQAVRDYNTKYGTNYAPEESVLGVNAQPNIYFYAPEKSNKGIKTLIGLAGTAAGMYYLPGTENIFNRALVTAGTEGIKRMFKDGGEVNRRTPSISEVPQVDVQGRVVRDAPVPQPTFTPGQQLIGAGETALSALSGLTAPASIAYDVLRGVPAKEVSPGRFMYEPRTEAGQETLQNVGRLAQEYKLDAALPQVQLQRPYPVGAAARQGIAGIEKGVEKMTLPTFRKITGNPEATKEQMMDFVLNQKSIMQAGAPAISRAPGGTFFTSEGSNLQRFIRRGANEALDEIGYDPEKAAAVSEMFYKKAQDFFEKRAGSISDELKQEMIAGRIKMPGELGEELFPKYLVDAAKSGKISAIRDLERRYDEMLGIKQIRLAKENLTETWAETQRLNQATKQSILAQFKQYPELIPDDLLFKLTNKDPTDVRIRLKDNPEYFSTVLEPKLTKLINIETEIVKPSDILNYESTYGRYAAENLSKNELEAIKRNKPLLDIKSAYQDLFGYDITDLARQAAKMSTKEIQDITFATFVSRASKLAVKQKTLEARANEIRESLRTNKSVDPKALSFGTEIFQELPDGSTWRKIVDPDATLIQSAVLDNSIKGYANYGSYGPFNNGRKALEDGDVELFVLYDKNGMPVTNVEMVKGEKSGKFSMRQAQGNGPLTSNVTPEDYLPQLKAFINKTTPEDIPFNISKELRYVDAPEGFAKGGIVDKPLYDRAA